MKKSLKILLTTLGLLVAAPIPLTALNPGDVVLTRVTPNSIILLALVDIPAGERIIFTDIRWTARGFAFSTADSNDGFYDWFAPEANAALGAPGGVAAGEQVQIDFPADSLYLEWQEYLFLFQRGISNPTFLYAVFADVDWNIWDNPARGLTNDITSITIGTISGAPLEADGETPRINHEIKTTLRNAHADGLEQLTWLRGIATIPAWTWVENNETPINDAPFTILPSAGLVEFVSTRHLLRETDGTFEVGLRRLYGNSGLVSVRVSTVTNISDFSLFKPRTTGVFDDLTGVAYGNGVFTVVGSGEGTLTSPDGITWTINDVHADPFDNLFDVTFGKSIFVAVGDGGVILTSPDGVVWTRQTSPTTEALIGVEFLNNAFIAVGVNYTILNSTDGQTWTPATVNRDTSSGDFYSVAFGSDNTGGNSLYAAVGKIGSRGAIFTSPDGATWSSVFSTDSEVVLWKIIFADATGFTAVGEEGRAVTSPEGVIWTEERTGANLTLYSLTATDSLRAAVGSEGLIITTEDDLEFHPTTLKIRAASLYDIIIAAGTAVVVGEYGKILSRSLTGGTQLSGNASTDFDIIDNAVVFWGDGVTGTKTQTINFKDDTASTVRRRFDLEIFPGAGEPDLGESITEISLFNSDGNLNRIVHNYGPFLTFKDVNLAVATVNLALTHQLSFRIQNTSSIDSKALVVTFDGSNLPDLDLPIVPANSVTDVILVEQLSEIVQSISLFEFLTNANEPVFKHKRFINSVFIVENRAGNGVKDGSIGRGFVTNLATGSSTGLVTTNSSMDSKKEEELKPYFSGGTPPPPPGEGCGECFGLVLTDISVTGIAPVETVGSSDFAATAIYLDPFTLEEFIEEITDPQPDWLLDPQKYSVSASGLVTANTDPTLTYPQIVALSATSEDGAAVDEFGNPVPVTGSLNVEVDEPASNQDYPTWVTQEGLSAGPSGETDDFEEDGIVNLLEFSLGMDPTVIDPAALPFDIIDNGGSASIQFIRPKDVKGVTYQLQTSTDLQNWSDLGQALFAEDSLTETWEATSTANPPVFFRLVIERFDQ